MIYLLKIVIFHHSYGRFAGFCRYPSFRKMEISMNWHHISASSGKLPPNPLFSRIHVGLHKGYCKPAAQQTRCPHLQKGELTHVSDRTFSDATSLATVRNCGMFCRTGERVVHVIGFSDGWNPHSILWSYSQCVFPYTFAPRMLGSLEIPWKISTMAWRSITCMKLILHRCFANPTFFYHFILCPPFHRETIRIELGFNSHWRSLNISSRPPLLKPK